MSNFLPVQAQKFRLAGSGITSSATTIILQSFKTPVDTNIVTADFGAIGLLTLEPGTSREEVVSFTTVTQNADGTATLTGVTRGLGFTTPYTAVVANQFSHAGGSIAVLSNPAAFYNKYPSKANDETISGYWTVPTPLSNGDVANKAYVDSVAMTGTGVTNAAVVVAGTAGETVAAGNLVYLKTADARWWKTDADTAATVDGVLLGIAQGAGTAGNSISGGVLIRGVDTNQSGLSAGSKYYASNTAGAISSSVGTTTRTVGVARTTTALYFDPVFGELPTANGYTFLGGVTGMVVPYAGSSAPTGFLLCDGSAVSRTTYAALFALVSTTFGTGDGSTTFNVPNLCGRSPIGVGTGTKVATFASRSGDVITVTGLTNAANNEFQTGQAVLYDTTASVITGLTDNTTYYVIRTGNSTFSLATSLANAIAGTAISLSSDGSGTQTFTLTLTARSLGHTGGEENHATIIAETPAHSHTFPVYDTGGTANFVTGEGNAQQYTNSTSSVGGSTAHNNMSPFLALNYIIKT